MWLELNDGTVFTWCRRFTHAPRVKSRVRISAVTRIEHFRTLVHEDEVWRRLDWRVEMLTIMSWDFHIEQFFLFIWGLVIQYRCGIGDVFISL